MHHNKLQEFLYTKGGIHGRNKKEDDVNAKKILLCDYIKIYL
jgi:hypothetical protein